MDLPVNTLNKLALMTAPVFYKLVAMSITASGVASIILLIRKLADQKISPQWKYRLWFIVLATLLVPYRMPSKKAFLPSLSPIEKLSYRESYDRARQELINVFKSENLSLNEKNTQLQELTEKRQLFFSKALFFDLIFPLTWFLGVLILLSIFILTKIRLHCRHKRHFPVDGQLLKKCQEKIKVRQKVELFVQSQGTSPALIGLFRPQILLPEYVSTVSEESFSYILLHELAHFKRRDMWLNKILLLLQSFYWFNPLIWRIFKHIREDMELMNDHYVLNRIDPSKHSAYARSLVEVLGHANHISLLPKLLCMVDSKQNIERRIRMIKRTQTFNQQKWKMATIGLILTVILSACFFTEAIDNEQGSMKWAMNLKEEEILQIEMIVFSGDMDPSYHRFSKEEYPEIVSLFQESSLKKANPTNAVNKDHWELYITTGDRKIHEVKLHDYLIIDGDWYEPEKLWTDRFPKEKADKPIPEFFHYGKQQEAFKGLELYLWMDENGNTKYTLLPATNAIKSREQICREEISTNDIDNIRAVLAQQKEHLTLFIHKLTDQNFTEAEKRGWKEQLHPYMPKDYSLSFSFGNFALGSGMETLPSNQSDAPVLSDKVDEISEITFWEVLEEIGTSKNRELDEKEISTLNRTLEKLYHNKDERIYPLFHFFSAFYETPEDLELKKFLRYFSGKVLEENNDEDLRQFEALQKLPNFPFLSATLSDMIVPIRRIPTKYVDEVLKKYTGISLKEVEDQEDILYLAEYDSFYVYPSDFGIGSFNCIRGVIDDDTIQLFSAEHTTLTLKYENGEYFIQSHLQR